MKSLLKVLFPLLFASVIAQGFASREVLQPIARPLERGPAIDECQLRTDLRKLWEDHITWTRVYMISALANLPDQSAAASRLLQNQKDIGDAFKPFYGNAAGNQLSKLLTEHILIAVKIILAAKSGNNTDFMNALADWYANADEIAAFLHAANPDNWGLAEMKQMMKLHLDYTAEELTARLNGNWSADVMAYDKIHNEILMMADELASGLANQFN
ncbi:MAG: hypothetical protein NDI63_04750 [Pseudobdellovibrio sp.]|nr:hypothetical protein [Pseudobdellovibrio sp.]